MPCQKTAFYFPCRLFFPEEDVDGSAKQVPVLANLVLQVALVGILDPLRQVAEEDERGHVSPLQHGDVLDLDIFSLDSRWREGLDVGLQDVVELRGGNGDTAVVIDVDRRLEHLVDALLGERRAKDDGEIGERGKAVADGGLEVVKGLL